MKSTILGATLLVVAAAPAAARPATAGEPAACAGYRAAFEEANKQASYSGWKAIVDDSAIRVTARGIERVVAMLEMQMNLELMMKVGCRIPTDPVMADAYTKDAASCSVAVGRSGLDASRKGEIPESPPECNHAKWSRDK